MPTYKKEGLTHQVSIGNDAAGAPLNPNFALMYNIANDMVSNGHFSVVERSGTALNNSLRVILKPSLAVDPLWNDNPWHIYFEAKGTSIEQNNTGDDYTVSNRGLFFKIGTPAQLPSLAGIAAGLSEFPIMPSRMNTFGLDQGFLGVNKDFPRLSVRHPATYRLTIVERGFVLAVWTESITEDFAKMGVICVQRGVGCDGEMVATGQRPLYMVTNISPTGSNLSLNSDFNIDGPRNAWYYNIVREFDTTVPMPPFQTYPSNVQGYPSGPNNLYYNSNLISDSREILGQSINYFPNRWYTPVTTDTGEYILLFPFGLCTRRFAFSDEIDLLAVSKADAYQSKQEVPITVYGDARYYTALNSNNQDSTVAYDSGVRAFILNDIDG